MKTTHRTVAPLNKVFTAWHHSPQLKSASFSTLRPVKSVRYKVCSGLRQISPQSTQTLGVFFTPQVKMILYAEQRSLEASVRIVCMFWQQCSIAGFHLSHKKKNLSPRVAHTWSDCSKKTRNLLDQIWATAMNSVPTVVILLLFGLKRTLCNHSMYLGTLKKISLKYDYFISMMSGDITVGGLSSCTVRSWMLVTDFASCRNWIVFRSMCNVFFTLPFISDNC